VGVEFSLSCFGILPLILSPLFADDDVFSNPFSTDKNKCTLNALKVNPKFFEMSSLQNQPDMDGLLVLMAILQYLYWGSS